MRFAHSAMRGAPLSVMPLGSMPPPIATHAPATTNWRRRSNAVNVIARSLAGFDLDDAQRIHVARALRSAFHGFAHLESGDGHPHPHDVEVSFAGLIELLVAGIRHLEPAHDSDQQGEPR